MVQVTVQVVRLPHADGLDLPAYETSGASGMDLPAAITDTQVLEPGARLSIPTGFRIAIPPGFEAQIRPRSGLALKKGLTVLNAPGTVDSDYRGEVKVILANLGAEVVRLSRGDRIAQLVIAPVAQAKWQEGSSLPETPRGDGGFGHTGT
jgi:dUTP pyrophosphatase